MKQLKVDPLEEDIDGNAFSILAHFARQARREGWTDSEIDEVRKKAKSGDYDHLIQTLMKYIEGGYENSRCDCGRPMIVKEGFGGGECDRCLIINSDEERHGD